MPVRRWPGVRAPAFMRDREPELAIPEKPPVVAEIVRTQLDAVFVTSSSPRNIQVSPAHRDPRALDWIACVKAEVTYRIVIADGKIIDRRRSDKDDNCGSENYQSI